MGTLTSNAGVPRFDNTPPRPRPFPAAWASAFWAKLRHDWVFNLASLVAFNLLMASFPIVLTLLAVAGLLLGNLSPAAYARLRLSVIQAVPAQGGAALATAANHLSQSAGILLVIGIVGSIYGGSRLFVVLEGCFGIIFRLRERNVLYQNLMAIGMFLLYAVLAPTAALIAAIPSVIVRASGHIPWFVFAMYALGVLMLLALGVGFFSLIYLFVPNRPIHQARIWPGTLVAAILLVLYQLLFPIYGSLFNNIGHLGVTAGLIIMVLVFFYYCAFILLLGAEINSWAAGQREARAAPPAIFHALQVHASIREVAGPSAGHPREDRQHHRGAEAMRDPHAAYHHEFDEHSNDMQPTRPADG